jgi:predicted nucleic acid-binding protein
MTLIYLDSNIYLDYWEDRRDTLKPLGEFAYSLLKRAVECEFTIIISDLVLAELGKVLGDEEITEVFSSLKESSKLRTAHVRNSDVEEARSLKRRYAAPLPDLIHFVFAVRNNAELLITRDAHFTMLPQDRIKIRKPEEI